MANLTEMRAELRTMLGSPNIVDMPNDVLDRFINKAQRHIGTRYPFHETRCISTMATVDGTSRYNLPSDLVALRSVWDATNGRKLRKATVRDIAELTTTQLERTGYPRRYVRSGNWIQLLPTPSGVYNINVYYNTQVEDLVNDDDKSVLPVTWHDGILLYARYAHWDERGDMAKAQYAYNAFKLWLVDKPSEIDMEKDDLDSGVRLPELERTNDWQY